MPHSTYTDVISSAASRVQISSIARLALGLIFAAGGIAAVPIFLKKHGVQ